MQSSEAGKRRSQGPDMRGAGVALFRAAQRAKEIAEAHGLKMLVDKEESKDVSVT